MTTFRAAYWVSDDRQHDLLLTTPEQSQLDDAALLAAAREEAARADVDLSTGEIVVGEWRER